LAERFRVVALKSKIKEKQDQKIAAFGSSYGVAGRAHFSVGEKKGLAKQDLS
jgi:hypothetical protein